MGVMNKLRDNTGVVLWILVIAFGVLWVLQDSGVFSTIGAGAGRNIIVVDGDPVSFEEYQRVLNAQMEQYQAQSGEPMPPQMVDLTREQVYNFLVEDRLREREMERLGIEVTDEELAEMIFGDNPHPIIRAYFGNERGEVDRMLLRNIAENPEARPRLLELENYLRAERRREKLDNLIAATARVTEQDVENEYMRRNKRVDARFVTLLYSDIPDDSVQVTESDLRDFYSANREEFKRERTYTINYVALSKDPTPEDSALVVRELERLRPRFEAAENDSLFLLENASEQPYTGAYFRADELDEAVAKAVFSNLQEGAVVGPVMAGGEAHLIKVQDVRPAQEEAIRARHILISAPSGNPEQRAAARAEAQELQARLARGESFAELARQYSDDPSGAASGGDLGWFGRGRMVAPFEEAAFNAPVGRVVGPVETQFGYHLIEVTDRARQEVQLADYVLSVRPDVATLNNIQERLGDLQYYASESGDFEAEAQRLELDVQEVQAQANQDFIPGIGNSRAITNFLEGADEGDLSEVVELNDQFVVLQVEEIQPEGYRPFEEVRAELEPRVRLEKKKQIQVERLQRALAQNGFEGLAQAVGAPVRTATDITLSNPIIPPLGREAKFVGTAFGLDEGETSGVVAGENGAYVIRVTDVGEPAPLTEAERAQIREQLLTQERRLVQTQWLTSLREKADIEDLRRQFQQ